MSTFPSDELIADACALVTQRIHVANPETVVALPTGNLLVVGRNGNPDGILSFHDEKCLRETLVALVDALGYMRERYGVEG